MLQMNNWAGLYTKLQRARIKLQNIFPKAIIQMWRGFILIFWESQVTRGLILNSCLFCCSIKLFHQIVFHLLMVLLHWQLNTLQIIVLICKRDPDLGKDSSAQCQYLENFKSKCLPSSDVHSKLLPCCKKPEITSAISYGKTKRSRK